MEDYAADRREALADEELERVAGGLTINMDKVLISSFKDDLEPVLADRILRQD